MAIREKDCFALHGRNDLSALYKDKVGSGMNEKQAAREVILDEHEKLHNDMQDLNKEVNPKYKPQPYSRPDNSKEINAINEKYKPLIEQATAKPNEPIHAAKESGTNEAANKNQQGASEPPQPPPGEPAGQAAKKEEPNVTSIKNAVVDKEREKRGLPPAMPGAKKEFGVAWDNAMKILDENPNRGLELVQELKEKPRQLTDDENAILLHHQITTQNAFDKTNEAVNKAAESGDKGALQENRLRLGVLSDMLKDIYDVGKESGTLTGRGLNSRKMLANENYTLASMETQKRAVNNGRPITEAERAHLEDLSKQVKDLQDKIDNLGEENKKLREENAMKAIEKETKRTRLQKKKEDIQKDIKANIEEFKQKLKEQRGKLSANPIPVELIPTIAKLAKNYTRLGITKFEEIVTNIYDAIKDDEDLKDISPDDIWRALEASSTKDKLDAYKKSLEKQIGKKIGDIEKVKSGTYIPTAKEKQKMDYQSQQLNAQLNRVKGQFRAELEKDRLKNRSALEKSLDTFVKWERAFKLSSPITLAKLTMAAVYRTGITPIEEVVGGGISKILPRKLTSGAYREAGFNAKAEATAIVSEFTKGMKDAYDTINLKKGGKSDLEALYGKLGHIPPEAADFLGHLHGALKAPIKRAEFERSMVKRTANMMTAGIDVEDPLVKTGIALDAYKDANRSIFMQDNAVSTWWQNHIIGDPKSDIGKARAALMQFLVPFIKVPTNIVGETVSYTAGVPIGVGKLAAGMIKGLDNVNPDEKDKIVRMFKKGSLGAGMLLLGYFNPGAVGGYYTGKRNESDVSVGGLRLCGFDIPKWMVHNPLLEALQIGATVRRVEDAYTKGEQNGVGKGIVKAGLGLIQEVPLVSAGNQIQKLFGTDQDRQDYLGELAKNTTEPALLQNIAEWTDSGGKRKPQNFLQHLEMGVPGLREKVPEKHSYSESDLKEPAFKYFTDKGFSLPYSSEKSISIKDPSSSTIKKLSDYPKDKIDEYYKTKKEYLKDELSKIEDKGSVYVNQYGEVSFERKSRDQNKVNLEDLSSKQTGEVLNIASRISAEKTKDKVFYNKRVR